MKDYTEYDAIGLSELIRNNRIRPTQLIESAIEQIQAKNPELNAVVNRMYDRALDRIETESLSGPFNGVPFLLKDLIAAYQGEPMSFGSKFASEYVPDHDSVLVQRYKQSGLAILGKTNTPEFGLTATTEPELHGPTKNPWNTTRIAGGSSGGSAAAVASGMVPAAHGNDGGGSIRIPAACCGLFGLKPTRGRITKAPDFGDIMNGLVEEHVLTRTVRDSAKILDETRGSETGDPYIAPEPEESYYEAIDSDPKPLKIAVDYEAPDEFTVHETCQTAIKETATLCEELGHTVEIAQPEIDTELISEAFIPVWAAGAAAAVDGVAMEVGTEPEPKQFEPLTWTLYEMGQDVSASDYLMAIGYLQQVARDIQKLFDEYDVWLTPTIAEPPVELGTFECTWDDPLEGFIRTKDFVPFTALFNVTGQPAMNVPLFWTDDNLPIGSQFAGRFGDEKTLFKLAAQLETANPWYDKYSEIT